MSYQNDSDILTDWRLVYRLKTFSFGEESLFLPKYQHILKKQKRKRKKKEKCNLIDAKFEELKTQLLFY